MGRNSTLVFLFSLLLVAPASFSLSLSLSLSQVSFFVLLWLFFLALGPVGRSFSFCVAQNFEVGGYAPIDISFRSVPSIHFITVAICLIRRVDDGQLVSMETDALVVRD